MDIAKAKELLFEGKYTCVLCKGEQIYTSEYRGVKPLVKWYMDKMDLADFSAADRVIGKATAFLYCLLGVKAVYTGVISRSALQVLQDNGIHAEYGILVENIINRKGDGICPFEEAVLPISDKNKAYIAICAKMDELNIQL